MEWILAGKFYQYFEYRKCIKYGRYVFEIIKCKKFIKENSERKNKINERNNNKEYNIISKRKNNKSQSPLKNQFYKLKKSFLN